MSATTLGSFAGTGGAVPQAAARDRRAAHAMLAFAVTGLFFMLVPGTLLGVWNLISISSEQAVGRIAPEWLQAHGHAQIFGWLGSFIIGIGYYSLPASRLRTWFGVDERWLSLALWGTGVAVRWSVGVAPDGWRVLLPLGALLELAGFAIFFRASAGHRPAEGARSGLGAWALVVIGGTAGFLLALLLHTWFAFAQALFGASPAFPAEPNSRFLTLLVWGFLAPFVWGFSARWVLPMLGVTARGDGQILLAYAASIAGVGLALAGQPLASAMVLFAASVWMAFALGIFDRAPRRLRTGVIHGSFRVFARVSYAWLLVGAALGIWGAVGAPDTAGVVGASRHALTVGFLVTMVFSIGPYLLPAFAGRGRIFSTRLMALTLGTLTAGCTMRVVSQILAYQGYADGAWSWLPVSAVIELSAVAMFAANVGLTFALDPTRRQSPVRAAPRIESSS